MSMKFGFFYVFIVATVVINLLSSVSVHGSRTTIVKHTEAADPDANGFWNKHTSWKSRWVKYWRAKTIYVPVWKKVWSPVIQNEWVPLPNEPLGWKKSNERTHVQEAWR